MEPAPEPERDAQQPGGTPAGGFVARLSAYVANALRYWEPRRLLYNCVLAAVVGGHVVATWPGPRDRLSSDLVLGLFFLAVMANVLYCAAYIGDLFLQFSGLDGASRVGRPILLAVGTAFAATIAHFMAGGLFAA